MTHSPYELEIIRDEVRRQGWRVELADEFEPRRIVGNTYRASEQALREEVRYWLRDYTDTSGT